MKIALGQFAVGKIWEKNLETVLDLMEKANQQHAELLVLPEGILARDIADSEIVLKSAQPLDGPFISAVIEKSNALSMAVAMTVHTTTGEKRVHNNHLVIHKGRIIACYTKLHLYDAFNTQESANVEPGTEVPALVEIGGFKFGLMTCYDVRFPEFARRLAADGADAFLLPAAWVRGLGKEAHWNILVTARALENTCYMIAVGECGERNIGASMVVDPLGVAILQAGEAPTLVYANLSKERIEHARKILPVLKNRKFKTPELT